MTRKINRRCFYCDRPMVARRARDRGRIASTAMTRDHVIPKSHPYYPGDHRNVVDACSRCNGARGDSPAILFYLFARETLQPAPSGSCADVQRNFHDWLRLGCRSGRLRIAA